MGRRDPRKLIKKLDLLHIVVKALTGPETGKGNKE
jgi:hypothetical protein